MPAADEPGLRDLLLRTSTLMTLAPEIQELDFNPVIVQQQGVRVVDARLRIARSVPVRRSRRVEY